MATEKECIQNILDLLNFPEDASFASVRSFLLEKGLCRFEMLVGDEEDTFYSLFSKDEVLDRQAQGLPVSLPLAQAVLPESASDASTLLTDPAYYRDRVVFPDLEPDGDDGAACKRAFYAVAHWFRTFMHGCSAGVMDAGALNRFKYTRNIVLDFRQGKNPINPVLSASVTHEGETDGVLEQKILTSWIYPFIFSVSGETLARIRRCRQCGTFFKGVRLHASFCTTKCRMAWNYASRA